MGFLLKARDEFGPVVSFDHGATLISGPDLVAEVLAVPNVFQIRANFRNQRLTADAALATTVRRHHLSPGLRTARVTAAFDVTHKAVSGHVADLMLRSELVESTALTRALEDALSASIGTFYFGEHHQTVSELTRELLDALSGMFGNPFAIPTWIPTRHQRRIANSHRALRASVSHILRSANAGDAKNPPYAMGVASACAAAGESVEATLDLLIGSLLAAQRVPAAAGAWVLAAIAADRVLQTQLVRESADVDTDPAGRRRAAGPASLLDRTIFEALRLNPPTWMLQRTVGRHVRLGKYELGPGHQVLISPYVIHRDDSIYQAPTAFAPERWLQQLPPRAFLPFGRGLRSCPGVDMSMVLLRAATTAVLGSYRLEAIGPPPVADPRSTLVPRGGHIRISHRASREDEGVGGLRPVSLD